MSAHSSPQQHQPRLLKGRHTLLTQGQGVQVPVCCLALPAAAGKDPVLLLQHPGQGQGGRAGQATVQEYIQQLLLLLLRL